MSDLKSFETKSNEVLLSWWRASFMPSWDGNVAASKSKPTKIAKKQGPSTKKIQLSATLKHGSCRPATTTKRTNPNSQHEDRAYLSSHLQRHQGVSVPRWQSHLCLQGRNQLTTILWIKSNRIRQIFESINSSPAFT